MTSFLINQSSIKAKVETLEREIARLPQVDIPPQHDVSGGIYARTGFIPAGTTFTGAIHTKDHINVIFGDVSVLGDGETIRLTGYHVITTKAGSKRVAHTHADTYWTTLIATELQDISEIEDEICTDSTTLQTRKNGLTHDKPLEMKLC